MTVFVLSDKSIFLRLNFIALGAGVAAGDWLLESLLGSYYWNDVPFWQSLQGEGDPDELFMRLVIVTILLVFGYVAEKTKQHYMGLSLKYTKINHKRLEELERFQKATVKREFRIKELRDEIKALALDGILVADVGSKQFTTGNSMICQMLGYSLNEIRALTVADIHPAESLPHVIEQFEMQARGEITMAENIPVKRKDGSVFFADIHSSPIEINGKKIIVGFFHDRTERKKTEEIVNALVESMGEKVGQKFFDGVTSSLCEWTGAECAIIGEFIDGDQVQVLAMQLDGKRVEQYKYALSGTSCNNVAAKGYCAYPEDVSDLFPDDKALVDMQAEGYVGTPIRDKEGNAIGVLCAISRHKLDLRPRTKQVFDIIASRAAAEIGRLRAEEKLKQHLKKAQETRQSMLFMLEDLNESRARIEKAKQDWEQTFDAVTDPILLHDPVGNIVRANRAYAGCAGLPMQEIIGLPYWQVFPKREGPLESCLHALKKTKGVEEEFETDDGRVLLPHVYVMRDGNGKHSTSIHFMQDITEQKQAERKIKESLVATIHAIAMAVEARDPYTAGHQRRVSKLATAIAVAMGLDEHRVEGIRLGAMIHDIGKIYLPAEILSKPSRLTETEYTMIKEHPAVGFGILKDIAFPWPIAMIAHQHHERMDGSGYPQGLKGEEICLESRIVAVADMVEAMSSHRPYRPGLGIDAALEEISNNKGKIYDADVVDVCHKLFVEKNFSLELSN